MILQAVPSSSLAQDGTLSRCRHGFKSRWDHHFIIPARPRISHERHQNFSCKGFCDFLFLQLVKVIEVLHAIAVRASFSRSLVNYFLSTFIVLPGK